MLASGWSGGCSSVFYLKLLTNIQLVTTVFKVIKNLHFVRTVFVVKANKTVSNANSLNKYYIYRTSKDNKI